MPLEKMSTILQEVDRQNTAVIAFDCMHYESIAWLIKAGEALGVPVMVMLYPSMSKFIPLETFAAIAKSEAAKASIPVGLHLDHCEDFDMIMHAMKAGFTSVMIDGSKRPFAENVKVTREIVKIGHALGVDVEAELGRVGTASDRKDFQDQDIYTTAAEAADFIDQTRADALAIAIGSAHGFYVETPKLDLQRLTEINEATQTPLVLHGGSGIPDEQLRQSFRKGINKLNVGTEYFALFYETVKDYVNKQETKPGMFPLWDYQHEIVYEYLLKKLALSKP